MTRYGPNHDRLRLGLFALVLLALPAGSWADSLKLSGFWIDVSEVRGIEDGQILYIAPTGGEVSKRLANLSGIRLNAHEQLEQARKQAEAGNHDKAIDLLETVADDADEAWLKDYAHYRLLKANMNAGNGEGALEAYLDLIEADADNFFIKTPPANAVRNLSEDQKKSAAKKLRQTLGETDNATARKNLKVLGKALDAQPTAGAGQSGGASNVTDNHSQVTLPSRLKQTAAVESLKQGLISQAVKQADKATRSSRGLAENLFIKGLAKLALADNTGDESTYKDAGLSFMRVVVYFDSSPYAPLALLETGYVHEKIGRPDIARKLYRQARRAIENEGGKKAYPNYYSRMVELTGGKSDASDTSDTSEGTQ